MGFFERQYCRTVASADVMAVTKCLKKPHATNYRPRIVLPWSCELNLCSFQQIGLAMPRPPRVGTDRNQGDSPIRETTRPRRKRTKRARGGTCGKTTTTRHDGKPASPRYVTTGLTMKFTAREIWLRQLREAKLKAAEEKVPGPDPGMREAARHGRPIGPAPNA